MQTLQLAVPAIATLALGAALLVPLRDDRRGRRATFGSRLPAPLRADFRAVGAEPVPEGPVPDAPVNDSRGNRAERALRKLRTVFERPKHPQLTPSDYEAIDSATASSRSFDEFVANLLAAPEDAPQAPPPPPQGGTAPHVVRSSGVVFERVVPLTRLPLRSFANNITWFSACLSSRTTPTRAERHALLSELAESGNAESAAALVLAYREEDSEGRILAMRALLRVDVSLGQPLFADALCAGTDDERAFAIDALVAADARSALIPAFSDRVEAIAAKAALAYTGTNVRDDYRTALAPHIADNRIEAILMMLAGFVDR